jgi:hypothetical protein
MLNVTSMIGGGAGVSGVPDLPTTNLVHHWHTGAGVTGSPVSQWNDQVGSRHLAEATNMPSLEADQINGYDSIRFDGSNDQLSETTGNLDRPIHTFCVLNVITWVSSDKILSYATSGSPYGSELATTASSPEINIVCGVDIGRSGELAVGTWGLVHYWLPADGDSTGFLSINDGSENSFGNDPADGGSRPMAKGGLAMGATVAYGSSWGNTEFAELALYSAEQAGAALTQALAYFKGKYSLW